MNLHVSDSVDGWHYAECGGWVLFPEPPSLIAPGVSVFCSVAVAAFSGFSVTVLAAYLAAALPIFWLGALASRYRFGASLAGVLLLGFVMPTALSPYILAMVAIGLTALVGPRRSLLAVGPGEVVSLSASTTVYTDLQSAEVIPGVFWTYLRLRDGQCMAVRGGKQTSTRLEEALAGLGPEPTPEVAKTVAAIRMLVRKRQLD